MEIVTVEPSAAAPDPDTLAESPESVILVADDSSKEASISRLEYSRLRAEASNAAATSSKLAYSTLFSDAFSSRTSAVDTIEGSSASVAEQPATEKSSTAAAQPANQAQNGKISKLRKTAEAKVH